MDAEKVGRFICELRTRKGLTQNELAAKINVTNKAVSRWERGKGFPDISLLGPLAKELDVSILELLNGEPLSEKENTDANILLNTMQNIKQEQKSKEKISTLVILTAIVLIMLTAYYINRFQGFDNRYFVKVINNIAKIPLTGEYYSIKNGNFIGLFKNVIANLVIIIIQTLYILPFHKYKTPSFRTYIIINLSIEIAQLFLLIGIFDISGIVIRAAIVNIIIKNYKKGGVVNEKGNYNCSSSSSSNICR